MNPPARRRLDLHRHDAVVVLDQELDLGAFCQAIFASFSELRNREIASFSEMRHSGSALLKSAKPEQAPLGILEKAAIQHSAFSIQHSALGKAPAARNSDKF